MKTDWVTEGLLKKWVGLRMCGWKFRLSPDSKTTDEPSLQLILKPNFLFYAPINKISEQIQPIQGENEKGIRY